MYRLNFTTAIVILALLSLLGGSSVAQAAPIETNDRSVASPNGEVTFELLDRDRGRLQHQLRFGAGVVIEPSSLGVVIDGIDLGQGTRVEKVERYEINERYPCRGVHSTALDYCRGAKFWLVHDETDTRFILEVRAFDAGVAFRHIVPGHGARTADAAIEFKIPAGSIVWHHDLGGHYEDVHEKDQIESIAADEWIAPPMTFKLPSDAGYAAITEGGLMNYAGMALQAAGDRVVRERLGHSQPVGHPFALRFSKKEAERLSHPAVIQGDIITPWRTVIVGKDLNTLVNSDIIEAVSPPPDKSLFPQGVHTSWIKPGRSVWKFLDGGESSLEAMMDFSRWAGKLGFEYNLIEGFWQRWSEDELRSLVDYSRNHNVGIWLWK
ncbi:MAG: glycoside hydrolase family 97 N-terminal domain-containing protein, partial [Pirellulales bacterium]